MNGKLHILVILFLGIMRLAWAPALPAGAQESAETVENAAPETPAAASPAAGAAEVESATAEASSPEKTAWFGSLKVSGTLNSSYQFRNFGGQDDSDIYEYFALRLRDIVKDRVDGAFSMFWHEDLDGGSTLQGSQLYDPFLDIDQADGNRFRFYTGYLDFKGLGFEDSRLRVGRQFLEDIDYAHFDGASYRFSPLDPLEVTLFGGRPVTFYSSSQGDAFYGADVRYRFTPQTKVGARYYRYDAEPFNDDLAAVEVWHMFTPELQTHAGFSLLDADPYLLQNDWYYRWEEYDFDIVAQVVRLFSEIGDHTINFNPYFSTLNGYEPFTYGSMLFSKGINEYISLNAGFDFRVTGGGLDPAEESTNRDYVRGTLGAEFYPVKPVTLSINGEYWSVDSGDEFTGVTGEVEYKPCKGWTLTAGAEYGEYVQEYMDEFLLFFGQEKVFRITPDVITYYTRIKWQPTGRLYTAARFELEDNSYDEDDWYAFQLQVGVNF